MVIQRANPLVGRRPTVYHKPQFFAKLLDVFSSPLCSRRNRPLKRPIRQITTFGVFAIVALRLGVGWHFFQEGAKKFQGEGFSSQSFLLNAKGPLADFYQSFLPDRWGRDRLDQEKTLKFWQTYKDRLVAHFGFDQNQRKQADEIYRRYAARWQYYLAENQEDLEQFFLEVERLERAKQEKLSNVPFQRQWIDSKRAELQSKLSGWLADLRAMEKQYEEDLHRLATREQLSRGKYPLSDRGAIWIDTVIKYTVFGIGALLILGLLTRLASLAGMMFLISVIASQPPWVPGAQTMFFYYQVVEVLAFLVLFAMAAGQFAGLDFVIRGMYLRCCPPKHSK